MSRRGPRDLLFALSNRVPLVREASDPMVLLVLAILVVATAIAVVFPSDVFPGDKDARSHVLQLAGGVLVLFAAYFTSVNLRETRAQHAFERLSRAIEQLGSESEPVRIGAIKLLESIALERLELPSGTGGSAAIARHEAVREALEAVAREPAGSSPSDLAREVLQKLEAPRPRY